MSVDNDIILRPRRAFSHELDASKAYDTIVVGSEPAGYSAAMYAARLGLSVLIIGEIPGGKIILTNSIDNYPGFVSIRGQKLAELMENHAMDYDVAVHTGVVESVRMRTERYEVASGTDVFKAKTVILATGTTERKLGVPVRRNSSGKE